MTKEEIIVRLTLQKQLVTELGYDWLQKKLPIELESFRVEMSPFILIEKAFIKAIRDLKKRNSIA